ncbi:hypothetical protein J5N97_001960 [Dioscorea zingiberensis]|uniref:RING-type E3 ubiquitin transferase n=1 Tax=Dioscorea zingiberensis TaxID=325984 RepID=A0A9D5BSW5_9LILI|nr:hypothetical protein J5N97_001960 [Dioscorea zingiberensis]
MDQKSENANRDEDEEGKDITESIPQGCTIGGLGGLHWRPERASELFTPKAVSKLKHEKVCKYRPYNCPYAGAECSVTGDILFLMMHLKNDHKVDMHDGCTFNHRYVKSNPHEVENATWMLTDGYSVHIAGLMRLDIEESSVDSVYVTAWASPYLPLHMGKTENASKW